MSVENGRRCRLHHVALQRHVDNQSRRPRRQERPESQVEDIELQPVAVGGTVGHRETARHRHVHVACHVAHAAVAASHVAMAHAVAVGCGCGRGWVVFGCGSVVRGRAVRGTGRIPVRLAFPSGGVTALRSHVLELRDSRLERGWHVGPLGQHDARSGAGHRLPGDLRRLTELAGHRPAGHQHIGVGGGERERPVAIGRESLDGQPLAHPVRCLRQQQVGTLRRPPQQPRRQLHRNAPSRHA